MPYGEAPLDPKNPNNGYILPQPPDDSVSRLRFSPSSLPSAFLLASSWNGCARLWSIDSSRGPAAGMSETTLSSPLLDCQWSRDGQAAYLCCADKYVYRWDLGSNQRTVVAAHEEAPPRHALDNEQLGCLASTGYDKTLRYWDPRAPTGKPMATVSLGDRAYALDAVGVLMVVALAERRVVIFDVRKPATPFVQKYSQLKHQSRTVACWPDGMGYIIGGVDGTVSIDLVQEDEHQQSNQHDDNKHYQKTGVFTCHHDRAGPFVINALRFNPLTGAFATAASDGHVFFWDKDRQSRARAKKFERMPAPVCDVDFYHDGSMYAYAVGYDWSKGAQGNTYSADSHYIVLQHIDDGDMTVGGSNSYHGNRGRGGRGRRRGYSRRGGG